MKEAFQQSRTNSKARSCHPDLVAAMNEVMANVGKTAPGCLLAELNALPAPDLKATVN